MSKRLRSRLLNRLPLQAALALLMPGLVSASQAAPPRQPLAAAQPERQPLASTPRVPDAAALFDGAPRACPQFFKGSSVDGTFAGYTFRFFPDTGNDVGVQGSQVAVLGPVSGGAVLNVGQLADFACLVYPADCAVASLQALPGLEGTQVVAATDTTTVALRSDGSVWAWGRHVEGQLGNSSSASTSVPVRATGLLVR